MKNILDYTKKNKPTFSEVSFNNIDALILSVLTYINYDYLKEKTKQRSFVIKDIPLMPIKEGCKNSNYPLLYYSLFKNVKNNPRYNELIIDNIYEVNNPKYETHFKAMTFQSENFSFIAYMGTGTSIYDWKEDFKMFYETPVPAQKLAVNYINDVIPKLYGDIYIGGHSKGGNLALYASIYTSIFNKIKIKKIYNFDGPGFGINIYNSIHYKLIKNKIIKYIPSSSIFGVLMITENDYQVVKCNGFSILQHNPFNWLIKNDDYIYLEDRAIDSKYIDKTLTNWTDNLSSKELKLFIETVFYLLGQEENNKIKFNNIFKLLKSVYKGNKKMDKDTKEKMNIIYEKFKYYQKENLKNIKDL